MREALFKTIKHSSIYGLGNFATKALTVLLIPLYTSHLTPSDYGTLQICNIFHSLLTIILMFGMSSSMFRVYYNTDDIEERNTVFNSTLITYVILAGGMVLILVLFSKNLANVIIGSIATPYLFNIIVLAAFFEGFYNLQLAYFRAEEKPVYYSVSVFIRVLFYLGLNIVFVSILKRNFVGVREVNLISIVLILLIIIPFTLRKFKFKFSIENIKEVLHIGIPLGIGGIAYWILGLTDRYMLKFLLPQNVALSQVGIYSLGAKIAMIMRFLLVGPFMISWGVLMFSYQNNPKAKVIYASILKYFSFVALIILLFLSLFSKEIIMLLSKNEEFHIAYTIVPVLALSIMLQGIYHIFTVGVTLTKKTKYVVYSNYSAAISNILLNLILIPQFGMKGAAVASTCAYIINIIIIYNFAQKVYRIKYQLLNVIVSIITIMIIIFCVYWFDVSFLSKLLIFVVALLILPTFGLVRYYQLANMMMLLKAKLSK